LGGYYRGQVPVTHPAKPAPYVFLFFKPVQIQLSAFNLRLGMPLSRFGFIIKAPGYSAIEHNAELRSDAFTTRVVGVSTIQSAMEAAALMVAGRVELIELCGGFTQAEAQLVRDAIGDKIPIGVVSYTQEQAARIEKIP
jgi:Family of unknown function (DUF6506)